MKRPTFALLFSAALLGFLVSTSTAQNETPRDYVAYWVEPYAGHLGVRMQRFAQNAGRHGYIVEVRLFDWDTGPYPFSAYQQDASWGCAMWGTSTHGSTSGQSIMAWRLDPAGLSSRNAAYAALLATGLRDAIDIYQSQSTGGYAIGVTSAYIASTFRSEQGIVFNGACQGHTYTSSWTNARCVLDYSACPLNITVQADCDTVFNRMNSATKRTVLQAIVGTSLTSSGNLNTVLSPAVQSVSIPVGTYLHEYKTITVTFDALMDNTRAMSCIDVDGWNIELYDPKWVNQTQLSVQMRPRYIGRDSLRVRAQQPQNGYYEGCVSSGGIPLCGPGEGPNRRDWTGAYYSAVDNPAASIAWFRAVRQSDGVHVEWSVESQSGTDHYLVEYAAQSTGPFGPVATIPVDPARTQYAVVDWGRSDGYYRLREVEVDGDILDQGFDGVSDPIPNTPIEPVTEAQGDSLTNSGLALYPSLPPPNVTEQILPIYGVTYITRSGWESALQPRLNKLASQGHIVNVVPIESFGATKVAQRSGISQYITAGIPYGLWAVCLAGDNEDSEVWDSYPWYDWVKPTWPSEAAADIIPSFYWPDPSIVQAKSQTWYTPHGNSDWVFAGPDSIPRIVITRIPARSAAELAVAVAKADAYERQDLTRGTIAVFTQAQDLGGNSGALAKQHALANIAKLPTAFTVKHQIDSPTTNYSYATRQSIFLSTVSPTDPVNRVVGMIYKGTQSNRNNLHWQQYSQGFRWNLLPPNAGLSAVLATYCEAAGTSRRVDPSAARGFMELAMTTYVDRGPALIIGANCGSNQNVNSELDSLFLAIVYGRGARSAADGWMQAIQTLLTTYPGDIQRKYAALMTGVIGFPETPWPGMRVAVTGVEPVAGTAARVELAITPNPSRTPNIRFTVPARAHVNLAVYDVSGRLVSRLLNNEVTPGVYHARLDRSLSAGLYFVRLSIGSLQVNERMVILH